MKAVFLYNKPRMKDGILCIDKPGGMTSRHVDNVLMKRFGQAKIGHFGTLDPFATGVLVIAIGKGTKFLPYLDDAWKCYEATLELGIETSTGDPEGDILQKGEVPSFSNEQIQATMKSFLGVSAQIPPMTSAIKIHGVPLYKKAHKGQEVERQPRSITVKEMKLLSYENHTLRFSCTVSKGTYIRVLGMDLAKRLGTIGYLSALRRTKLGPFSLSDCHPLDTVTENDVTDPSCYLQGYPIYEVKPEEKKRIMDGASLTLPSFLGDKILVKDGEQVLAVYRYVPEKGRYEAERGLF